MPNSTFTYEQAYQQKSLRPIATDQMAELISDLLIEIMQSCSKSSESVSIFTAKELPKISLKDYLKRIAKFSYCSQEALIIALIFVDRLTSFKKNFHLNNGNIHRYFLKRFIKINLNSLESFSQLSLLPSSMLMTSFTKMTTMQRLEASPSLN